MARTLPVRAALLLLALAMLPFAIAATAHAQEDGDGAPQITFQNLNEGDVLGEPPHVIQLCFGRPVTNEMSGGDYSFSMKTPEGLPSGDRTVFQRDRMGVAVYPGDPPTRPSILPTAEVPVWTFEWLVTDAESGETAESVISFTIEEGADVIPDEDPPACVSSGITTGPAETGAESPSPADGGVVEDAQNGDDDRLLITLGAAGMVGTLAVVAVVAVIIVRSRARRNNSVEGPPPGAE